MLWEEFSRTGDAIAAGLRDEVEVASVVVAGGAKEPSVEAVGRPRCARVTVFIYDSFSSKGS